jgi:ribosome assembly protein 4
VTFSPDGRWVLSASFDKSIKLWDGVKGGFIATFRGHVGPVFQVAWSSDSRLFVSGSKDSTLKVRRTLRDARHGIPLLAVAAFW